MVIFCFIMVEYFIVVKPCGGAVDFLFASWPSIFEISSSSRSFLIYKASWVLYLRLFFVIVILIFVIIILILPGSSVSLIILTALATASSTSPVNNFMFRLTIILIHFVLFFQSLILWFRCDLFSSTLVLILIWRSIIVWIAVIIWAKLPSMNRVLWLPLNIFISWWLWLNNTSLLMTVVILVMLLHRSRLVHLNNGSSYSIAVCPSSIRCVFIMIDKSTSAFASIASSTTSSVIVSSLMDVHWSSIMHWILRVIASVFIFLVSIIHAGAALLVVAAAVIIWLSPIVLASIGRILSWSFPIIWVIVIL